MRCSKCGSEDAFYKESGNEMHGKVEAICGNCNHRSTLNEWDYSHGPEWNDTTLADTEVF